MKKLQFKAHPLNERVLAQPGLGVKPVPARPATVIEPFELSEGTHHDATVSTIPEDDLHTNFHARPVPKSILEGIVGVAPAKKQLPTVPQSPAFQKRVNLRSKKSTLEPVEEKVVLSHPVPDFSTAFKPHLEHKVTEIKPFTFESSTEEMRRHREEKIRKVREEEEKARQFRANPLPDLSVPDIPEKPSVLITKPAPFNFAADERGKEKARKWEEKMDEELKQQREATTFKARPADVLRQLPFEPQKADRSRNTTIVDVEPFDLMTDKRAQQRADFEQWRKERDRAEEEARLERERERQAAEEEEVRRLRSEAVHRAQPVRRYKQVPPPPKLPVTVPTSPRFSERLRPKQVH